MSDLSNFFEGQPGYDESVVYAAVRRYCLDGREGRYTDLRQYLPADGPNRLHALVELIRIDLERRLSGGTTNHEGINIYLSEFPEIAGDNRLVHALLQSEYELLCAGDTHMSLESFLSSRYPNYATEMLAAVGRLPQFEGYEILGLLGAGGMGAVYKARHRRLNRVVALKVMLANRLGDPAARRRFMFEAEVAAMLDHRSIVPIFGCDEQDGRHCISMRLIHGFPLAQLAPLFTRDVRGAARLVAQVARAVHHAHQQGVIHRDLKPSNILIDGDCRPHICDLGLAKLVEGTQDFTASGTVLGTPGYVAPEQARSPRTAGTPADIYSLGAVLYFLLTGRPPFLGETALETVQQSQERDPETPRSRNPRVDRDLETICLKCLDRDPARRYGSARELADDLDRWLGHEPIVARPPGLWGRTVKFARRKPALAGLYGVIAAGMIGASVAGYVWAQRERVLRKDAVEQRDIANEQKLRTRQALDDMLSERTLGWLATLPRLMPEQKAFLERAARYYEDFAQTAAPDADGQFLLAGAHYRLARIYALLGDLSRAVAAGRQATELFDRLDIFEVGSQQYLYAAASNLINYGVILKDQGKYADAEAGDRRAVALTGHLLERESGNPSYRRAHADARSNLGVVLAEREKPVPAEAEAEARAAIELYSRLAEQFPDEPQYRAALADSRNNLSVALGRQNKWDAAFAASRLAIKEWTDLVNQSPAEPRYHLGFAYAHNNLGAWSAERGNATEAEQHFNRARDAYLHLARDYPAVIKYAVDCASALINLGFITKDHHKNPKTAADLFTQAIDLLDRIVQGGTSQDSARMHLIYALWGRALARTTAEQFEDALADWAKALGLCKGGDGELRAQLRCNRSMTLARSAQADPAISEAEGLVQEVQESDYPSRSIMLANLAAVFSVTSRNVNSESERYAKRSVALLREAVQNGYRDFHSLLQNPDLDPLRKRADFADLLWDLADGL